MKKAAIVGFVLVAMMSCQSYKKDGTGMTLYPVNPAIHAAKMVRIDVITPDIIHVQAFPEKKGNAKNSLILDSSARFPAVQWTLESMGDSLILKTEKLMLKISKKSGKISYFSERGIKKLEEPAGMQSSYFSGEKPTGIRQIFDSPEDEALYGLGAHQNGQVNYKGEDVHLLQHNIVDVVPFLLSSKNYGILWDNYSISRFGDPREYQPLSTLRLFDESGREGGLTGV